MNAGQPDLMIMDVYLLDMTGTEATRRIRAIEELEHCDPVPIIAATASTLPEERAACIESGVDDFITKPLNKAQLQAKLRYWMGRRAELAVEGLGRSASRLALVEA